MMLHSWEVILLQLLLLLPFCQVALFAFSQCSLGYNNFFVQLWPGSKQILFENFDACFVQTELDFTVDRVEVKFAITFAILGQVKVLAVFFPIANTGYSTTHS